MTTEEKEVRSYFINNGADSGHWWKQATGDDLYEIYTRLVSAGTAPQLARECVIASFNTARGEYGD